MRAVAVLFIVALAACGSERSPAPADVPADAPLPPDAADVADAPPDAPAADADAAVPDLDVAADAAAEADVAEVGPDVLADVPTDVAPEEVDPCPGACGPLGPGCVDETHRGECVDADGEGPGCPEWTEAQSCMPGEECSKGECLVARCLPDCPEMKLVPAGPFWMGCNNGTGVCPGNAFDEMCPPEGVFCYLIQVPSFYMDRFEVTVAAFRRYVEDDPKNKPPHADSWKHCSYIREGGNFENHPVNCVDWHQANAYCEWAGGGRRLCSESEWEKAARGTDGRLYPWGNEYPSCEYAVLRVGEWGTGCNTGYAWPVGSKPAGASPYGVDDLEGNVSEMAADCHHEYHGAPPDGSADLDCPDKDFTKRVRRGLGDLYADPQEFGGVLFRASSRLGSREDIWGIERGFRCCRSR